MNAPIPLASGPPPVSELEPRDVAAGKTGGRACPRLSVVIVNYDSWPDVERLVSQLTASPSVRAGLIEVLVVDNASPSPVPDALRAFELRTLDTEYRPVCRLLLRPENDGFAAGVNAGWRNAHSPWILIVNPDIVPGPDFPDRILEVIAAAHPRTGVIGLGLLNPDGTPQPSVGPFPRLGRLFWEAFLPRHRRKYHPVALVRPGNVPWVTGACMLARGEMLDELNGLDEDFFLYYEEVDLCRRAWNLGWRVKFHPDVVAVHENPLQNRGITPLLRIITRHSKLLYYSKHLSAWQYLGLSVLVAAEAWYRRLRARTTADRAAWKLIGQLPRILHDPHRAVLGVAVRRLAEEALRKATDADADAVSLSVSDSATARSRYRDAARGSNPPHISGTEPQPRDHSRSREDTSVCQ